MESLSKFRQILIDRLVSKGLEKVTIPSLIRSMRICLVIDPTMNHLQLDKELQLLGWYDIKMDFHTLQIANAYFESKVTDSYLLVKN